MNSNLTNNYWEEVAEGCQNVTGKNPEFLWQRVGQHSGTVTFGLNSTIGEQKKMVLQVFDRETKSDSDLLARYEMLKQLASVHQENDGGRFVKSIACIPEQKSIIFEYVPGEDLWPIMRQKCSRITGGDIESLLVHVKNIATWTVRVQQQTQRDCQSSQAVETSLEITHRKLHAIWSAGILPKKEILLYSKEMRKIADSIMATNPCSVLAHGDLCPANILVDGSSTYIIDIHTAHRALAFEDAAYFLSSLDGLLIESVRYVPRKIVKLKDAFIATYRSFLEPPCELIAFQMLTAKVQILNYYTGAWKRSMGLRRLLNRWRIKYYRDQVKSTIQKYQAGGSDLLV